MITTSNIKSPSLYSLLMISDLFLGKEKTDEILAKVGKQIAEQEEIEQEASRQHCGSLVDVFADIEKALFTNRPEVEGEVDETPYTDEGSPVGDGDEGYAIASAGFGNPDFASATITITLHGPRDIVSYLTNNICEEAEAQIYDAKADLHGGEDLSTSISTNVHTVQ